MEGQNQETETFWPVNRAAELPPANTANVRELQRARIDPALLIQGMLG